ncbi:MAG TPA: hypothetical protein ENF26_02980 [Methanomicrobia archaeon]|nr:hypothetical protein [Methanomicrobia archaeon]HEX59096.1 hypothetical protein [Methanomicrobia archaeon]
MDTVDPAWPMMWAGGLIEWPPKDEEWEKIKKKPLKELTREEWWKRTKVKRDNSGKIMLVLPNGKIVKTGMERIGTGSMYAKSMKKLKEMALQMYDGVEISR